MKAHHVIGDGISLTTLFMQMSVKYDPDALPGLKPLGFFYNIITNLAMVILLPKLLVKS